SSIIAGIQNVDDMLTAIYKVHPIVHHRYGLIGGIPNHIPSVLGFQPGIFSKNNIQPLSGLMIDGIAWKPGESGIGSTINRVAVRIKIPVPSRVGSRLKL